MRIFSTVVFEEDWLLSFEKETDEKIDIVLPSELDKHSEIANCEILIARDRDLSEDVLDKFLDLRFIFIVSAGVEKLPFEYLRKRAILVAHAVGISDETMSDYVIGAMLNYSCKFWECYKHKQNLHWQKFLYSEPLSDKVLLVVGAGRIGKSIARKAKAFNMKVLGIRQTKTSVEYFDKIADMDSLYNFASQADYIACLLPLTERTKKIFNSKFFSTVKKNSVFINISRGGLVDENALCDALTQKKIYGAVLDVFDPEPLDKSSRLWKLDNAILTPHSSGRIKDFLKPALACFMNNLVSYKMTGGVLTPVDLEKGY